jgi:hypothetical protein
MIIWIAQLSDYQWLLQQIVSINKDTNTWW